MFNLRCLESTEHSSTKNVSKFCIEPLNKGQGITIGNALRRTLLSSIEGVAIVGVRIFGISHEFSLIPGVKEDIMEVLLNLKQIILKGHIQEPVIARLNFRGPGIITAKDIQLDQDLTCIEPDQYIAFVYSSSTIEMEFLIEGGVGYSLSEKKSSNLGFLTVDAVFMPVRKVNFFIETIRNDESIEIESLILEVETDGSTTSCDAVNDAANILENMFSSIKISDSKNDRFLSNESLKTDKQDKQNDLDNILIEELELSVRAFNCLKRANIHTIGELLNYSPEELLDFKNFGKKSADEVLESLSKRFNLRLNSK
jgi:DNA-directed RNA polymerase subunit alpha